MIFRRLTQLYVGLAVYGFATAMVVRSNLGLNAWDVLHQGLDERTSLSFGSVVILTGLFVLILWIPLRQRPGLGTISNVILIGVVADIGLQVIPVIGNPALRVVMLLIGVLLLGVATSAYIGADFGPGPRDGLMTGIVSRSGWSVRTVRTGIELTVLAVGWWLGGAVGLGTLMHAVLIGPIIQSTLLFFDCRRAVASEQERLG